MAGDIYFIIGLYVAQASGFTVSTLVWVTTAIVFTARLAVKTLINMEARK